MVRSGWEGLHGRPRPVPLAPILEEHDRPPSTGDHQGPPNPTSTALAPMACDGLFLGRRLLQPIDRPSVDLPLSASSYRRLVLLSSFFVSLRASETRRPLPG